MYVYIYIKIYRYIYMYGHQSVGKKIKISILLSFIVRNDPENPHTWFVFFSRFNVLSSFSALPFLALNFHTSLRCLDILNTESGPWNEVRDTRPWLL